MAIRFACNGCHARIRMPDGAVGRSVQCPRCGKRQTVPATDKEQGTGPAEPVASSAVDSPSGADAARMPASPAEASAAGTKPIEPARSLGLFDDAAAEDEAAPSDDEAAAAESEDEFLQADEASEVMEPEEGEDVSEVEVVADEAIEAEEPTAAPPPAPVPVASAAARALPMTGSARPATTALTSATRPRAKPEPRLPIAPGGVAASESRRTPGATPPAAVIPTGPSTSPALAWVLRAAGAMVGLATLVVVLGGGVRLMDLLVLAAGLAGAVGFCAAGDLAAAVEHLPRPRR